MIFQVLRQHERAVAFELGTVTGAFTEREGKAARAIQAVATSQQAEGQQPTNANREVAS